MKVTNTMTLFLLVSLVATQFTAAQTTLPSYCTDGSAVADYIQCIVSNSATCTDCSADSGNITNLSSLSCSDITNSFCPAIRCCSACETAAAKAFECYVIPLFATTSQQACTLDCTSFPYGDNGNGTAGPCDTVTGSWIACFIKHNDECLACTGNSATFDPSMLNATDECAVTERYLCPYVECCSSCQSESDAYYQCILTQDQNSVASGCNLNCSGTYLGSNETSTNETSASGSSTNGSSTNGTSTSGGTTNKTSTSGGTTNKTSTNGGTTNTSTKSGATKNAEFVLYSALASIVAGVTAAVYLM
jgi:hypothetical protein